MYRKTGDFLRDWEYESESTLKILRNIGSERFSEKLHENVRDIATLARHIVHTLSEMMERTGLEPNGPSDEELERFTPEELAEAYRKTADSVAEEVRSKWTDESLLQKVNMYGEEWANGYTLHVLIMHQAHHRGQLTVLMRQAGMKVHGIYGPAREEWEAMGLPAMK